MLKRLAVGVDLSDAMGVAIGQAMSIARHHHARVELIHVVEPRGALARARDELEALVRRLDGGGIEISKLVVEGKAATTLAETAGVAAADLLVVGTHGRTGARRLVLGSVAEQAVRISDVSVLVARGDASAAEGGFRRVVVGTDFSPLADRALDLAVELAAPGAEIEVVHAWAVPLDASAEGSLASSLAELGEQLATDADRAGAELVQRRRLAGSALRYQTLAGEPTQVLVAHAEQIGADLIVVGSHGRRGIRRLVLGSVAETTVRHASMTVVVAR